MERRWEKGFCLTVDEISSQQQVKTSCSQRESCIILCLVSLSASVFQRN